MSLPFPKFILCPNFDILERFGLGELDTVARTEDEELEEER
jgi:hypothetical protein